MFKTLTSVLRFAVGGVLLAVCSVLVIAVGLLLMPWRIARIRLCNFYGKVVGRSITAIAGVTPVVHHRERLEAAMPAIYISNHTSTLDAFLGIWLCPYGACGVLKKEVARVPFFGWLAVLSGHILLDRFHHERAIAQLGETAVFIRKNRLGVWILPEGTRSRTGELLPFKKGFVHLAITAGFPVVPVVVHGAHLNWETGTFHFKPRSITIEVLPPVDTSKWKAETAGRHADELHALFAAKLGSPQQPLMAL
jgi:lysophosphatidate acyltransferase